MRCDAVQRRSLVWHALRFLASPARKDSERDLVTAPDKQGNAVDSGNAGKAKLLINKFGALDLAQSGFTASGPADLHVVLLHAVKFKEYAVGKLRMQRLATDDFANARGPEPSGM